MRIAFATVHELRIPFAEPFRHALAEQAASDSIVLRLGTEAGAVGFGECTPRAYVTGETRDTCVSDIRLLLAALGSEPEDADSPLDILPRLFRLRPEAAAVRPAARCAVELALTDAWLRERHLSLRALAPPCRSFVTYSGVIGAETAEKAEQGATRCRALALSHVKLKVRSLADIAVLARVRQVLGDTVSLRLDANAAFDPATAARFAAQAAPYGIAAFEQPIPRGDPETLAALRAASPVPIMADESLVSLADARALIEHRAVDLFNIRLSKCGGIGPSLAIARLARDSGVGLQLGCHVGETAILSAAGRHVAAHLPDLLFAEGSYGEYLLAEDIGADSVVFGQGGRAPVLSGPGLGVETDSARLERHTVRRTDIGFGRERAAP